MVKSNDYEPRFYRGWTKSDGLVAQEVVAGETDLFIYADKNIENIAGQIVRKYRLYIEDYIKIHPVFKTTLEPIDYDPFAPDIIKDMITASTLAAVGPMASVAGAISEYAGKELLAYSKQVIVENGGDIFIKSDVDRKVGIFAGSSPLTGKLNIKVRGEDTPIGICTSSGTVGHSLSFGKADACVIIAKSAALADAAATSVCNRVKDKKDIKHALEFALSVQGVKGALIVLCRDLGVLGDVELI